MHDDPLTSSQQTQDEQEYGFCWSVASQRGYKYASFGNRNAREDIHPEMEDVHFPTADSSPNFRHVLTGRPFQLFMLADGHGGHVCAQHIVSIMPPLIVSFVNSRAWHLNDQYQRLLFQQGVQDIFEQVDTEYCERKLAEYH